MTKINEQIVAAAGYKLDAKGENVLTMEGKRVKKEVQEGILEGAILGNFDMKSLKAAKNRAAASGSPDLVTALRTISPHIEKLEVGQTAKIKIPEATDGNKDPKRSFVMSVVTKLNNITALGREWAGKKYDSASDAEGEYLYVARLEDGEAKERKRGGRGPGKGTGRTSSSDRLASALNKVDEQLSGDQEEAETNQENGVEEAMVIKH